MKGLLKVKGPIPKFFAIPTTAGTGSETTVSAVITDEKTHHKYVINDFDLIPNYAVLDADLTVGLPVGLTATTGMDALTHAIEAYIGGSTTPETRKHALESARLIFENLPKVCEDGKNIRARSQMLKASYLAGLAFTRSYVGYVHAVAHTLGGKYGVAHGLANAVILPYVLAEYGSTIYKKLKVMAVYCNIARPYDNEQIATSKLLNRIREMNEQFGIPKTFDCIVEQDIPALAALASKEANPLYPVPKLMNAKELTKIYYRIKA
jgi:alcohol dehydrogenase class IV